MRVLVVHHDESARQPLQYSIAAWGYEIFAAANDTAAYLLLQQTDGPTLALIHHAPPMLDGTDLVRRLRNSIHERPIYVILLVDEQQVTSAEQIVDAGADDFILAPFVMAELKTRLRAAERITQLQIELCGYAAQDPLTGAWNQEAILKMLTNELTRAARGRYPVSIVMLDADRLDDINKTYGQSVGNEVLSEISRRASRQVRPYDAFGRYSGAEFLMVLPQCTTTDAMEAAERVRAAVASAPIEGAFGSLNATISIGIATKEIGDNHSIHDLIQKAATSLFDAKRTGKNRIGVVNR